MDLAPNSVSASASQTAIALLLLGTSILAAGLGYGGRQLIRRRLARLGRVEEVLGQETYLVSQVLGLLFLLLSFTYGVALDQYEDRRTYVSSEANVIGNAFVIVQMLDEPHRARISELLKALSITAWCWGSELTKMKSCGWSTISS